MTTAQFYFLVLVIISCISFGVALAASCIRYRGWLAKQRPTRASDNVASSRMAHAG